MKKKIVMNNKNQAFESFKKRILSNINSVDIDFEIGYCYKQALVDMFESDSYWTKCYRFLKNIAAQKNIKTYR
jgi:hypothetical protein